MTLVTLADVQDALPTVQIDDTTQPSQAQVAGYCARIEADTRAHYEACPGSPLWPDDAETTDNVAVALKQTVLEGVKSEVMRAKFALSSSQAAAAEGKTALDTYNQRLAGICVFARAAQASETTAASGPAVAAPKHRVPFALDFNEASEIRDIVSEIELGRRSGYGRLFPW